jgi:hypothetical protein
MASRTTGSTLDNAATEVPVKKTTRAVAKTASTRTTSRKTSAGEGESGAPAAPKAAAARKKAAALSSGGNAVQLTPEERQRYVAEAAYFIAERRGFAAGGDVEDWLQAEAEIDQMLAGTTRH